LQATGELNSCHTFIGIALRSALRMGLHRHLPTISLGPVKDETRRRVFYTIRQMDIYLSTTLGLPLLLEEKDIDQPWPAEVDDQYITDSGIQWPPPGTLSMLEASNANLRLMHILAKVVRDIYPPTGTDDGPAETYMISFSKIRELEQDLRDWHGQLSPTWRPGHEEDIQVTRYANSTSLRVNSVVSTAKCNTTQGQNPTSLHLCTCSNDAIPTFHSVLFASARITRNGGRALSCPRVSWHQRMPQYHTHRTRDPQAGCSDRAVLVHHLHAILRGSKPALIFLE
jgi:hypothetical protein